MAILDFQQPDKVIMHKETANYGLFEFSPLERGYGITVGNAMRRILLSSLEGWAITSIRIPSVDHEFSTIKGVLEDVTEIILNLKQVRFKKLIDSNDSEKIFVSIKGKEEFKAGEIARYTNAFEILNPDFVICTMEPYVNLEIELTVEKGRGYVPAEENSVENAPIGEIAIDSIFTPIKNVKYHVEDFRVEQKTDYEKLIFEVKTDGSIHPEEALKEASKIMMRHLVLFSDESILEDTQVHSQKNEVDENMLHMRKILKTSLSDLDLSVRAYNCLKAAEIRTLGELVSFHIEDLLKFRNFGKKSLTELEDFVKDKGLNFGMDVSKYNLEDE
ncbi:MAG: DNA-directed RNA polymerase subunit alpha [Bacteroidia bacterium]|jgi:DNA-directed RNA polymerase subunit alpha|nr:DNA-directed RNA polymerase subunit alpha [Bacteroidia bacterium]MDG2041759.1 DNA-directed RNA polymerase subunit alpha [Bacteroidia bacterium]|tara:strand:+ start:22495 stop:23487 length:993 start_codon:yes stop_codon:yes gene_type:complete